MTLDTADVPLNVYRRHLEQGQLAYQYSIAAERAVFPPRVVCPYTGDDRFEWRISEGRGTVYSLTQIAPRDAAPYCVALIDLDEGFRMMSRILPAAGRDPRIGDRVRVQMGKLSEQGETLPLFVVEESSHA